MSSGDTASASIVMPPLRPSVHGPKGGAFSILNALPCLPIASSKSVQVCVCVCVCVCVYVPVCSYGGWEGRAFFIIVLSFLCKALCAAHLCMESAL